ncbi:MAG: hypothetical protein Q4D81_10040, partial [Eubacteriales bacterium]|nr:hypothetical protein [Eubacteriales bacterium]
IAFPERFEKQYAFMESHPEVIACGTKTVFFTDRPASMKDSAETASEKEAEDSKPEGMRKEKTGEGRTEEKKTGKKETGRKKTEKRGTGRKKTGKIETGKKKMEDMETYRVRMLFVNPGPVHSTVFLNHEKLLRHHIE